MTDAVSSSETFTNIYRISRLRMPDDLSRRIKICSPKTLICAATRKWFGILNISQLNRPPWFVRGIVVPFYSSPCSMDLRFADKKLLSWEVAGERVLVMKGFNLKLLELYI
jgi:hypothetical protein